MYTAQYLYPNSSSMEKLPLKIEGEGVRFLVVKKLQIYRNFWCDP